MPDIRYREHDHAADEPQQSSSQRHVSSVDHFELRAFGAEADFWDGRASLDVHLPFDWCLATDVVRDTPDLTPNENNMDAIHRQITAIMTGSFVVEVKWRFGAGPQ